MVNEQGSIKILFVDDEAEIAQALAKAVGQLGYQTLSSTRATEAVELVEAHAFDIVVSDLVMPEMNGIDLVKRLLTIDPGLRCVILTAHGAVDSCDRAYRAGVMRFMQKPVSIASLSQVFEYLTNQSASPPASLDTVAGIIGDGDLSLSAFKDCAIKRYLERLHALTDGDAKAIAQRAGVSMATVYRLLKEHHIGS